jgi:hypothetical protein
MTDKIEEKFLKKQREKRLKQIEAEKNQKPVKSITIEIEWKKSAMWGMNPHCVAEVRYKDGSYERSKTYKASGCGYDKESTVIADVFNDYLRYKAWAVNDTKEELPYGLSKSSKPMDYSPHYGSIGTTSLQRIAKFIGGELRHTASGKMYDCWEYTENVLCNKCGTPAIRTSEGHWCKLCHNEMN